MKGFKLIKIPGLEHGIYVNRDGSAVYYNGKAKNIFLTRHKSLRTGYYRVKLGGKLFFIHKLVALAFVKNPDPENLDIVMHLNSNTLDNHYKNLKWGTRKASLEISIRNGLNVCKGNHSPNREYLKKIPMDDVLAIAGKLKDGYMVKELCNEYGISHASVNRIRKKYTNLAPLSPKYSKETKQRARELFERGNPPKYIAMMLGIRYETIWKWSKKWKV